MNYKVIWKSYYKMGWTEEAVRELAVSMYGKQGLTMNLNKLGATVVVFV